MAILNIQIGSVGLVGVSPRIVYINTNDTDSAILAAGYLNHAVQQGYSFSEYDMCCVSTRATPSSADIDVGWYGIDHVGQNWSLVTASSPGDVILPTIANHIAVFTNTTGTLSEDATIAINGGSIQAGLDGTAGFFRSYAAGLTQGGIQLVSTGNGGLRHVTITNAAHGQASVYSIPDSGALTANFIVSALSGTQHITVGGLQVDAGAISSGLAAGGFVGSLVAYPTTTTSGSLALTALVNSSGNFSTTISNATAVGQSQVITIPNSGAAAANFLLDTGAANILAMQEFVGLSDVLAYSAGTWTTTRIAQGNYAKTKAQANDTTVIGIDITPQIRVAASKGFRLDSFDVIYGITTLALDAHSVTLDRVAYANNVAVSVTSIPLTATLATATQANPYLTNAAIVTPAFDVTADSKYVIEVTVDAGATSDYAWYGVMLRFSQTIA